MRDLIVCLHSSASNGGQWRALRDAVGGRATVLTPNLIGYGDTRFALGDPLTVADEVDAIVSLIRANGGCADLVGHSYGGAIATHVALWYPQLVASLTVYEPVLASLLYDDAAESPERAELEQVGMSIIGQVDCKHGRWRAAREFVNFWAEGDAWRILEDRQRARVAGLMPKIAAEFYALANVATSMASLGRIEVPVRLYCGDRTRKSARRMAELFAESAPRVHACLLEGLTHMAPVTHPDVVNPMIVRSLLEARPIRDFAAA